MVLQLKPLKTKRENFNNFYNDSMSMMWDKLETSDTYNGNAKLPEGPAPSSLVGPETNSGVIHSQQQYYLIIQQFLN